jgi:hypothetical protein
MMGKLPGCYIYRILNRIGLTLLPAPYNDMYSAKDVIPPVRSDIELNNPNPLMEHLMEKVAGKTFSSIRQLEKKLFQFIWD